MNNLFSFYSKFKYLNPNIKYPNPIRSVEIPERFLYLYIETPENPTYPIQTKTIDHKIFNVRLLPFFVIYSHLKKFKIQHIRKNLFFF